MAQYEITGLGPVRTEDGSRFIFTRQPQPFNVTAAWLKAQTKEPAVGDVIEVGDEGALTLVTEAQAEEDKVEAQPAGDNAEKKSLGSEDSDTGSEVSPFKQFQAKPIIVHAAEITEVGEPNSDGSLFVVFADGSDKVATSEMLSRITPEIGDYWVIAAQDEGVYEYLNPKAVFEAKYQPLAA